ncbi:MAG: signal peptidase I [Verrucomicrobia bacterium]|nr:signal peptidase I [Verrucomicrobiota bacterium]
MFGFFSQERKMRDNARNWIELADKVWHFRRDVLAPKEATELRQQTDVLRGQVKAKAGAADLKLTIESLEEVLRRTGGAIYPKTSLVENVEFFLVAAIVILGIRTYFVQPFKIPTNSMWPTYYGMTPEVFTDKAEEPSAAAVAARAVLFGAWPHRLDAPADGEILIPIGGGSRSIVHCDVVPGRSWGVIPTEVREYSILVGDAVVKTKVPLDFDFDWAVYEAFFASGKGDTYTQRKFIELFRARQAAGETVPVRLNGQVLLCLRTGKFVKTGERVLAFDELTGDQLFVDRVSYHFMRPQVGQGFVFRTDNIRSPDMQYAAGNQIESYYIKRLVGTPGDTLEVREPVLYRNGKPITGASAFEGNAKRLGVYAGYMALRDLEPGKTIKVPETGFYAMGDNSGNSMDSRYWGFVPKKDAIGRPLFIYFPFTKRWGPAR